MSALPWVSLGIGSGGLLLASGSFSWQVLSWFRGGPVVRVEVSESPIYRHIPDHGKLLAGTSGRTVYDINARRELVAEEAHGPILSVVARNHGRLPGLIVGWGFWLGDDIHAHKERLVDLTENPGNTTIEPHGMRHWVLPRERVASRMREMNLTRARAYVILGTGKEVLAKEDTAVL